MSEKLALTFQSLREERRKKAENKNEIEPATNTSTRSRRTAPALGKFECVTSSNPKVNRYSNEKHFDSMLNATKNMEP